MPQQLSRALRRHRALAAAVAVFACAGCSSVARQVYDRDIQALRAQTDTLEDHKRLHAKEAADWKAKQAATAAELGVCRGNEADLQAELERCHESLKAVADKTTDVGKKYLQCEDEKLKMRSELLAERNKAVQLANRLAEYQRQLDALTKVIADVRQRLVALVNAGKLRVEVKDGFLVIGLDSDILFDTGKSDLKSDAKPVLIELATALRQFRGRRFQVAGHTDPRGGDDVNWKLSVDRAVSVVRFLIADGAMPPDMLSAGGYAHYLPAAEGSDAASLRRNRRVEFLLLPDLTELYNLATVPAGADGGR